MARGGYDEDGWRDYDGACDEYRATVREDYADEYAAILAVISGDAPGGGWDIAMPLIEDLADLVADCSDTAFSALEGEGLIETMVEGDI